MMTMVTKQIRDDGAYLDVIETYGHDMATHRSIDIAINVLTDADTDTPCMYDTVLHVNVPNFHSVLALVWDAKKRFKVKRLQMKFYCNASQCSYLFEFSG